MAGKTTHNKVVVSAEDRTGPTIKDIKKRFAALSKSLKGLKGSLKGLATVSLAPLAGGLAMAGAAIKNSIQSMVAYGGSVDDASRNLSIASDALQGFRYAADQSGSSAAEMDGAIAMLNKNMANVANGSNKNLTALMKHLNISMTDANGNMKTAAELMPEIADAMKRQTTATQKAYIATQFFGKSGQGLIKTLSEGSEGLAAQRAEAEHFGVILSKEGVAAATLFGDSMTRTNYAVQGVQNAIAEKLLPIMQPMLDDMNEWIASNRQWLATTIGESVKDLALSLKDIDFKSIISGAIAFTKASVNLFNKLGGLKSIGIAVAALFGAKVVASFVGAVSAIGSVIKAAWALNAVLWANPVVLIIGGIVAAIAAVGAAVYYIYKNWDEITAYFSDLWTNVKSKFSGFDDWLSSFWDDACTGAKIVWNSYVDWNMTKLTSLIDWFGEKFTLISDFMQTKAIDPIKRAWTTLSEWFSELIAKIMAPIDTLKDVTSGLMNGVKGAVGGAWDKVTGLFSSKPKDEGLTDRQRELYASNPSNFGGTSARPYPTQDSRNTSDVTVHIKTDGNAEATVENKRTTGNSLNTTIDTGNTVLG